MKTLSALVLAILLAPPTRAAEPNIWESPLPPQPSETKPFRPVKVPKWVEGTLGVGYTLSAMDSKARAKAAEHGVTISEMNFVDPYYPYYDSKLLKKRSPHVALDKLPKDIAEYKKLGVRILAVYPPTLQGEVYETHRDWRRIPTDTTVIPQIDMKKFGHGGSLCPLGPYGKFFVDVLVEILEKHPDVDAFSFDGLHHGSVCYCEHCRKNYKADTGQEIPKSDLNDPASRRYQHWADRRLEDLVASAQARLKAIKPEVALVTWSTNAGRFGHFLSVPRNMSARMNLLFDAPDQEFWLDESNRGNTIVPAFANAYAWSATNHRVAFSEPYLMSHGNPYGKDSFPAHEIERRMMLALTYGAGPSLAVAQPAQLQDAAYHCLDGVQKRKAWLTHKKPEPWAAMLMSDNTKTFYGRESSRVEERYLASAFGAFRACAEEHLPVALINDWNLTDADLKKYAVLILPNAASLDAEQCKAIERFVRNGGGLVASLDTSLFDEFGDPRPQFALSELLGVEYRGQPKSNAVPAELDVNFAKSIGPDYWEKRKQVFDFNITPGAWLHEGKLKALIGLDVVTLKAPAVVVKVREGSRILGSIRTKDDPKAVAWPAIVERDHGKGRVIYLAAGFDAGYYSYSYPYQRLILANSIRRVAGDVKQPVTVEAPMCVHSTIVRQTKDGKERLIVHLFNDVNTTGGHAFPNDDVPLREETLPIRDIRVTFRAGYKIKSIRLEPDGKELAMKPGADGVKVTVPRLDIHTMVVAELE